MKIKTKILLTFVSMSVLVALVGALAVNRHHASAMVAATKEAENVARVLSFLISDQAKLPESIQEIVAKLHRAQGRDVIIVDVQKRVVADAVPAEIGEIMEGDRGNEISLTMKDRKVRTFVEVSEDHPVGIKQIVVPIEAEAGRVTGAVILEYTPFYNELMLATTVTIRHVALFSLGSAGFGILLALLMGQSIGAPLQQLTDAATAFAANRTDLTMPPFRPDEIGELVTAFNSMVESRRQAEDALRRTRDKLEIRVAERTAELAHANTVLQQQVIESRKAAEQIREQAALLDKAQDAILVRGLDDIIQFWNKSAERLYGWTAAEAIGRPVTQLLYLDTTQFISARQLLVENGAWIGELQQRRKDGREITIEGHWTLVRDEEGRPKSILAINTDITERNLLKSQLIRAQRLESLGTLAAGIAHDLNNTLSPITMAIELLKRELHDPASLDIIGIVETNARRGADMVRQVLSFARGQAGERITLQPKYLINEVKKIAADTFPKNLDITTNIAPDLWEVLGDSTQLHQVLLNLCVNARDAMPKAGRIEISARNETFDGFYAAINQEAKVGPYIVIEVRDTGTGMPASILEQIFDPFFTTKKIGQGTGLGLSTSLGIVKSHGGFITVTSEVGNGTSFRVHLPAEIEPEAPKEEVAEPHATKSFQGKGELVLIVDDEEAIRVTTQHVLEAFGYRVLAVSDGSQAIALYAKRSAEIAVVLTDMMMPVMDGATTIAELQRINPKVKIISSTGLIASGHVTGQDNNSSSQFLPKPYTAMSLLRMLAQMLGKNTEPLGPFGKDFARGGGRVARPELLDALN
jgi:PAS domain S-box-containing protein